MRRWTVVGRGDRRRRVWARERRRRGATAGIASISEMASASLGHRGRGVWGGRVLCAGAVHAYTLDYTLLLTRF